MLTYQNEFDARALTVDEVDIIVTRLVRDFTRTNQVQMDMNLSNEYKIDDFRFTYLPNSALKSGGRGGPFWCFYLNLNLICLENTLDGFIEEMKNSDTYEDLEVNIFYKRLRFKWKI